MGATIPLRHRTLRSEVRNPEDNWLEVSDQAERRKLQNRLHQRAWRRKRKETRCNQSVGDCVGKPWTGHGMLMLQTLEGHAAQSTPQERGPPSIFSRCAPSRRMAASASHLLISPILTLDNAVADAASRSARPRDTRIRFPLSPDHLLITMVQYNVKRALLYNMALLGLSETLPPAKQDALLLPPLSIPPPTTLPPSLYPTTLQLATVYDPRIAVVPCPAMRNNLILLSGMYDMDALASGLHGGLFEGFRDTNTCGVMIWGEPWRLASWEVTSGFLRKWGFLLEGCSEVLIATNRWRESREEEPICWEMSPSLEEART